MVEGLDKSFDELSELLKSINLNLDSKKIEQLKSLCGCLIEYNKHTNLVADASPEILVKRHILDSLSALEFKQLFKTKSMSDNKQIGLIDLGTGAGFPGICLAIWFDAMSVRLVDSNGKKTKFLTETVEALGLSDRVKVTNTRIEELGREKNYREKFDLVTSRAFGQLFLNAELGLPLLKKGGKAIFYKSKHQIKDETVYLNPILKDLGAKDFYIHEPKIQTGSSKHVLVEIVKEKTCSKRYPRNWSQIKQQLNSIKELSKAQ